MKNMKNIRNSIAVLFLIAISITACVKGDFDEPPLIVDYVDFEANTTIGQLKDWYKANRVTGTNYILIEENIIISGVVVANDESGNLFKKIVIQDETSGVELSLDQYNLYTGFKLGQRIFVKCQNMYIGDYNELIQLGYLFGNNIGRLPDDLVREHVFRDSLPGALPEPNIITIDQINDYMYSTLVQFESASFAQNDVGLPWAPQGATATNRVMLDKSNKPIDVRTSSYAEFSEELVPAGFGTVTGILGRFRNDPQLTIRDTTDLVGFDESTPPPPPPGDFIYPQAGIPVLTSLDEKFDGVINNQDISIPGWTVQATAGARYWRGREFNSEKYAQATAFQSSEPQTKTWMVTPPVEYQSGLKLSFKSAMAYYAHDGLSVWILYNYDGTNHEDAVWEEINATLAGAPSGDHTWVPSGDINLGALLPAGYSGNIYIGFLYEGSPTNTTTYRIDDVLITGNGGGGGGGGEDFPYPQAGLTVLNSLEENFNNVGDNQDISLPGWTVEASAGSRYWRGRHFQTERYAQATAFQTTDPEIRTWMVTPPVQYQTGLKLSFKSAMAFYNHNGLSVWILHNYDGTNQEQAVWQQINANLAGSASGDHTWVSSGDIDLASVLPGGYSGNIYIGFLYEGSPSLTTTYRIDDVLIDTNGGGGGGGGGTGSGTQNDPYNIETGISLQNQSVSGWVKGYIVGAVKAGVMQVTSANDIDFSPPFSSFTNVLIADYENETNYMNCIAVNLPSGSALRSQVNLNDNPGNVGKTLNVNGTLRSYFSIPGLRDSDGSTSDFELD